MVTELQIEREAFSGRSVLITGGAGFIGSRLAHRLAALGARITVIDSLNPAYGGNLFNLAPLRGRIDFNVCDLRDSHALEYLVLGQDYLFNLAAQTSHLGSMEDPIADVDINIVGQMNLLEACRKFNRGVRMVFASTRQVYGAPDYLPVDESHPIRPPDVNGVSKFAAEGYHLIYDRFFGVRSTVLRLTNTYGPGMRIRDAKQTFVGVWLRLAVEGKPFLVFGSGEQLRDFNYVEDVVDAFLITAQSPAAAGRVYNLGCTETPSLLELANMLVELVPGASYQLVPFPTDRKQIDIGSCFSSYRRIESELGWKPSTRLRDGLARSLDYYREHFAHYVS